MAGEALVRGRRGGEPADSLVAARTPGRDAQAFAARAWSASTRRAYKAAWARFRGWCDAHDEQLLPASDAAVADYIADLAKLGRKTPTINLALSAIAHAHQLADLQSPTRSKRVQMVLKGIRNEVGVAARRKAPVVTEDLREITGALSRDLGGHRDRALLLLTYSGAFRRSEVVALDVADLRFVDAGVEVTVKKSKTDQFGSGAVKIITYGARLASCPVRALRTWIDAAAIEDGPVFREVDRHGRVGADRLRPRAVARVVKKAVVGIGRDPKEYGAHSLRSGMITTAIKNGVSMARVMAQSGHRSVGVLVTYDRRAHLWDDPASAHLGL